MDPRPSVLHPGLVGGEFDDEVGALLDLLPCWARRRPDIRAVALIGSWAAGTTRPGSDLDVLMLTQEPLLYTEKEDWIEQLGGVGPATTRVWGAITERRFRLPSGLEVELDIGRPSWASVSPVDEGTRRVQRDGLVSLYDPDGLLKGLSEHCRSERAAGP